MRKIKKKEYFFKFITSSNTEYEVQKICTIYIYEESKFFSTQIFALFVY